MIQIRSNKMNTSDCARCADTGLFIANTGKRKTIEICTLCGAYQIKLAQQIVEIKRELKLVRIQLDKLTNRTNSTNS